MAHLTPHDLAATPNQRALRAGGAQDAGVGPSWERCATLHRLNPDRVTLPVILGPVELRSHREPVEELLTIAQGEVQRLFDLLFDQNYIVILSDAAGVALGFRATHGARDACNATGIVPGSLWSEEQLGTNGIGLCLREQRPVSVVMGDHYASMLNGVSCTAAPIFGAAGELVGVLNVTTLRPTDYATQSVVRQLAVASARRIENLYFDRRHRTDTIVRVSGQSDFCDSATEARIALDTGGRVLDATPIAHHLLGADGVPLIGCSWSAITGIEEWSNGAGRVEVAVPLERGRLYLRLEEPSAASRRPPDRGVSRVRAVSATSAPKLARIVGGDESVAQTVNIARRLVAHRVPVLLRGETGTGKSALARALYLEAGGDEAHFVAVHCAAMTADLMEIELFGCRTGNFNGVSRQASPGRLMEADGGMLFLDEIGDLPLALQTRLLQVLSDGEFVPIGAVRPVRVNFALVAASLHDLAQRVVEGRFREDLYFRLAGATVHLPALRHRADRVQIFEEVFAWAAGNATRPAPELEEAALRALAAHTWPGNFRELHHAARFALAVDTDGIIDLSDLPPPLGEGGAGRASATPPGERHVLEHALARHHWNVSAAATSLGVSRSTLHRRMRALGVKRPE